GHHGSLLNKCGRGPLARLRKPGTARAPARLREGKEAPQGKSTGEPHHVHHVWFQNRRAKWRRQEKMEASSMKLHDTPVLSFNRPPMTPNVGPMSNSLPLDPWLTSPISSATTVHSIPGFMGAPQALQPPYGGHSFLNTPAPMAQGMQPMAPAPYQCGTPFVDKYPLEEVDQRSSSIASLRMKAKEHIQTIDKTWQPI
ncbi:retinal homeobox protein Rx1, partial [Manacus vitellinus]|uniref:retinal homeobox protein Rx1 n=1 Tax=Manacus vitellinus TaxID=328815 RepID=UPI00115F0F5C